MPADRTLLTEDGAARSAVLIAALGLALFALFAMVLTYAGVLRIGYSIFLGPITGLIGLNLLLAARPSTWRGYAWMAWAYEGIHAIVFTWILHELGGVSFSLFLPIFGFLVVHTEMLHPNASPFVTANLCTLAYGLLGWGEYQGWVRPTPGLVASVPASTAVVYVVFAALSLNFLALYARRHGVQLRTLANGLEEMVEVRTAELRESNANLRATAAALEHKRDEIEGLAYSITHDLKNPINAMLLLADLILRRDGGSLSEDARADLERIVETGERSERMVLDLLGMFRVTTAVEEPTLVSLDDLV